MIEGTLLCLLGGLAISITFVIVCPWLEKKFREKQLPPNQIFIDKDDTHSS